MLRFVFVAARAFCFFGILSTTTGFAPPSCFVSTTSRGTASLFDSNAVVRRNSNDGSSDVPESSNSNDATNEDPSSSSSVVDDDDDVPVAVPVVPRLEPPPRRRSERSTDPLVNFMTDPGAFVTEDDEQTETMNLPLLGEVPKDGSLLVLAPAAAIAVLGFLTTFVVAFRAKDEIVDLVETAAASAPPPRERRTSTQPSRGGGKSDCKGLCSSQDESLEYLRGVMGSLANSKTYNENVSDVAKDVATSSSSP